MNRLLQSLSYIPSWRKISVDLFAWIFTLLILLVWRISTEKTTIINYIYVFGYVLVYWIVVSYILQRYRRQRTYRFIRELLIVLLVSLIVYGTFYFGVGSIPFLKDVSIYVVTTMVVIMFIVSYTIILIYQFYRYATNMDDELPQVEPRLSASVLKAPKEIDSTEYEDIKNEICRYTDQESLDFLQQHIDLKSSNTRVFASTTLFNFNTIRQYRYSTLVNLAQLNSIRGINRIFNKINEKLPDDGIWCVCYKSIEQLHDDIDKKYPPVKIGRAHV